MSVKIPPLGQLIESYVLCCCTEGKSRKTTDWYRANLSRFSRYLKEHAFPQKVEEIGTAEARSFIFHLQNEVKRWEASAYVRDNKHLSPFSVQGYARSIKAFWSWLLAEGYISQNPMAGLRLPRTPRLIIATFSPEQTRKMLDTIDRKTSRGLRDYTMMLVLLDTGVRLSELIGLNIDSISFDQSYFVVRGKGGKDRVVPFGSQVRRALWRYLSNSRPEPDSPQVRQAFLSDMGLPLRPRAIQSMISRLGKRAGITGVRCSPHTFRHTFAKQYLMNGGDVFSLQKILGHSSLEPVKIYVNLSSGEVSAQHRQFSPVDNMQLAANGNELKGRGRIRAMPPLTDHVKMVPLMQKRLLEKIQK